MARACYPMQLSGGAFLICTGIALAFGELIFPYYVGWAVVVGFVIGFGAVRATLPAARARWGDPSRTNLLFFRSALALEFGAFAFIGFSGMFRGQSFLIIMEVSLVIVALHFLVMRWSHGPLIAWLGATMLCWAGLVAVMKLTVLQLVVGDGLLMLSFGITMARPLLRPAPLSSSAV
jgi:hypothetical protein